MPPGVKARGAGESADNDVVAALKLCLSFYLRALPLNGAVSVPLGVVLGLLSALRLFPAAALCSMTAGPLVCIAVRELFGAGEYYFYYNAGLSKARLLAVFLALNCAAGVLLLVVYGFAAHA